LWKTFFQFKLGSWNTGSALFCTTRPWLDTGVLLELAFGMLKKRE
jgi:hypothetical protein